MKCHECINFLNDYLDNLLDQDLYHAVTQHLESCSSCGEIMEENRTLLHDLRNMPAPSPSPGFVKLTLNNATRMEHQRQQKKWWLQIAAIAAMVCLVVLGSMQFMPGVTSGDGQQAAITMSLHEQKEVTLLVHSAKNMQNATITIELPPQLMLAHNPDLHYLSWQVNFREGNNFIPLPLVATGDGIVQVVARIEYQNKIKIMRTSVRIMPAV